MTRCTFCNNDIEKGSGKMLVENTGKINWFCSSKCEKNTIKLRRDPRNFKWVNKNS